MNVKNFGIPGANTARILREELPQALAFRPTLTILLCGTNDTCNSHALIPAEESGRNIRTILEELRKAGSDFLLMTPPPFCSDLLLERHSIEAYGTSGPEQRMEAFRRMLKELAGEQGIPLLDLVPPFLERDLHAEDSYLTNPRNSPWRDGLHPNRNGYRRIAELLAGTHDFTTFASAKDVSLSRFRDIYVSRWDTIRDAYGYEVLRYRVAGNAFLYHQVRSMAGTMLEAEAKGEAPDAFRARLEARDRSMALKTAPSDGLYLADVSYDSGKYGWFEEEYAGKSRTQLPDAAGR